MHDPLNVKFAKYIPHDFILEHFQSNLLLLMWETKYHTHIKKEKLRSCVIQYWYW
jgi:hypothetical protein